MKEFRMKCKVCDATLKLQGDEEHLEKYLDQFSFMCPGRHVELGSPRNYLEHIETVEIDQPFRWEPKPDRNYVDIHKIKGLEHIGFGMFKNSETREIYDYETDESEARHYYIV